MSIARLVKVSLAASIRSQDAVLHAVQGFGHCHLIERSVSGSGKGRNAERDGQASEALLFLKTCPYQRRQLARSDSFDFDHTVTQALAIKARLRDTQDALEQINHRLALVAHWGDFRFPAQKSLAGFRFWFYLLPVSKEAWLDKLKKQQIPWQIVGRSSTSIYLVVISRQEPDVHILPVPRQHLGSKSLNQLKQEQDTLEQELDDLRNQRHALTRFRFLIEKRLVEADNKAFYRHAKLQCEVKSGFFTLQLWLPQRLLYQFQVLAGSIGFAFVVEQPLADELPPTLLQPNKLFRSGALLAGIYQLPSYRAWDPSVHLYLFFSLFFAMILSDAGYALLLACGLGLAWRRMAKTVVGADLRWLAAVMIGSALMWGVLVGSYFGLPPSNTISQGLQVFDLSDYPTMMKLSVFIGVVHIVVANFSALGIQGNSPVQWAIKCGWSLLAVGGFTWWLLSVQPYSDNALIGAAQLSMVAGALAIFVASGWQPWQGWHTLGRFLINGFLPLLNATKLFGDILSYMRLFALGLASASLAITFNQLAVANIHQGGLALMGGVIILLLGHGVNLLLAIMGGVVHGLRLNFIEFYNWGQPGEGYPFVPFALKELPYE